MDPSLNTPPLRILIAEDDALIGMLLTDVLTDMGHAVCGLERTQAGAIAAALRLEPDLMIVDAHLGTGSGIVALQEILQSRALAYIIMSGRPVHGSAADAIVLRKPFANSEMARAMVRALGLHGQTH